MANIMLVSKKYIFPFPLLAPMLDGPTDLSTPFTLVDIRPNIGRRHLTLAHSLCESQPRLGQSLPPNLGQVRPQLGPISAELAPSLVDSVHNLEERRISPDLAACGPNLARVANFACNRPAPHCWSVPEMMSGTAQK